MRRRRSMRHWLRASLARSDVDDDVQLCTRGNYLTITQRQVDVRSSASQAGVRRARQAMYCLTVSLLLNAFSSFLQKDNLCKAILHEPAIKPKEVKKHNQDPYPLFKVERPTHRKQRPLFSRVPLCVASFLPRETDDYNITRH